MELIELTIEDVIKNGEEYNYIGQQFFVKTKYRQSWRSAFLYPELVYDDDLNEYSWYYEFEFEDDITEHLDINAKYIEHICIIK